MAPKTPSHTTQTTEVKLPAWVDSASQQNYQLASELGSQDVPIFQGNRVGQMSGTTQNDINSARDAIAGNGVSSLLGRSTDLANSATGLSNNAAGIFQSIGSGNVSAANFLDKYMNPYTDDVVSKSLADMDQSRQTALMGNSAAANAAGAFGGSRHGVADAVTNAQSIKDQGTLASTLRANGFNTALGAAQGDVANMLSGASGMNSSAAGLLASSGQIGSNATALNDTQVKKLAALMGLGQTEQQQDQANINAEIQKFNEPRQNQIDNLNLRLSALGMSPYGKSETTDKTVSGGSSGTDVGQLGMGIFSLLLGLSEDSTKTDKEKVGKLPGTDLDLWAYRYKKDPKTYPKVVGVMASDVEKKMPAAVHKVDGKRVINYGMLAEAMSG